MRKIKLFLVFMSCSLVTCSTTEEKFDFELLLQRESPPLKDFEVSPEDGFFTARFQSLKKPEFLKTEKSYYGFQADIGTERPLICFFYRDPVDSAHGLKKATFSASEGVAERSYKYVDAGVVDGHPYLRADMMYFVEEGGKRQVGYLKAMTIYFVQHSVLCLHDEIGYIQTFTRTVERFIRSLKYKGSEDDNHWYREVYALKLKELKIGFSQVLVFKKNDGTFAEVSYSSMFVPLNAENRKGNAAYTYDAVSSSMLDKKGFKKEGTAITLEDGAVAHSLKFKRKGYGYNYSGTYKNKPVKGRMRTKRKFVSDYAKARSIYRKVRKKDFKKISFTSFWPSRDLKRVALETYRFKKKKSGGFYEVKGKIRSQKGDQVAFKLFVTPQGKIEKTSLKLGEISLATQLIFQDGIL